MVLWNYDLNQKSGIIMRIIKTFYDDGLDNNEDDDNDDNNLYYCY